MNRPTFCSFRLHIIASFQAAQIVPEAYASSQQNRSDRHMQMVNKSGFEKITHHGRSTTYPYILAICGLHGHLQRFNRGRGEKVEGGAASHFD